jgi:hypothetical protein
MDPPFNSQDDPTAKKEVFTEKFYKNRFVVSTPDTPQPQPVPRKLSDEKPKNFETNSHETKPQEVKRTSDSKLSEVEQYPRPTSNLLSCKKGGIKHISKPRGLCGPPSTTLYTSIDEGNASCRFSRPTCNAISIDSAYYGKSMFPLGVVYTPLAELGEDEQEIPLIEAGILIMKKIYSGAQDARVM